MPHSRTRIVALHEWRLLQADKTLLAIALLLAALVGYSLYNGVSWVEFQRQTLAQAAGEESARLRNLRGHLADIEGGRAEAKGFQDPRSAGAIGGTSAAPYLAMPPAPLGALAIGQSDLYPYYFKLNLRSKQAILANDEIENPTNLLAGRFDLAFVLIFLFPLLILALGYNLISAEREQGTLPLALSQPLALRELVGGKILLRGAVLLSLLCGFTIGGAALGGVELRSIDTWVRLALWLGMMFLYTAFWFGLAVLANTYRASSATNALSLAGAWLAFVLVLPSIANLIAVSLYPVPSRVEMVQAMRVAGKEAQSKGSILLSQYMEDHPELAPQDGSTTAPDFASLSYAIQLEVDKRVQPILNRFDHQVSQQQNFVDAFRFLSPAILVQSALNDIAGTSLGRYQHFTRQVEAFFDQWQAYFLPKVFAKTKLLSTQVKDFPRYEWVEEETGSVSLRVGSSLVGLLAMNALVLAITVRRLRIVSIAD